jgi:prolyl-tRNA editing enzyme YbaK/EbsC (Cys-tRNA(Pro) deacylase)
MDRTPGDRNRTVREGTILDLSKIYINEGRRGFLVGMCPGDVARILSTVSVHVAI